VQRIKLMKLDDALWSRVTRLGPHARRLLELVAVAGIPIAQGVAADAAAIDLGQLFDLAAVLRSAHFAKTGGTRREDKIEPYHDRVRESVLAHLDHDVRARWHARLATALERSDGPPDAEALANHWHAAGNIHRAAEYAERAADGAMQTLAFERAARLYRFALEMNEHPKEAQLDIKRRLAEALTNAGYVSEAAEVRIALANEVGGAVALDLRRRAAEQLLCSGRFDTGLELLRSVLDAVGIYFPRSPIMVIFSVLVARLALLVRGLHYQPRDVAQASSAELARADAAWAAGAGFSMTDNIRGAYFQTRNLIACLRMGDMQRISRALAMEVCFRSGGGMKSMHRSRALLTREWEIAREVNTSESIAMAHAANGYFAYMLGHWTEARPHLQAAEEAFRDRVIGAAFQLNSCRMMLYRVLAYQGDLPELALRVPPVLREVERQSDNYSIVNLLAGPMTFLALADDAPDRVRDTLGTIGDKLPRGAFLVQHYFAVMGQCQVDLYCEDGVAALARVQDTWPALRRSLLLRVQAIRIMAYEQRARCAIAASVARASSGDHLAIAERDATELAREGLEWGKASATMIRAAIAAARGRKAEAIAQFEDASRQFDAIGMALYAGACERRAGELRGGEAGEAEVRAADDHMSSRGVKRPDRMTSIFAPPLRR
jgi:hypothetical protein